MEPSSFSERARPASQPIQVLSAGGGPSGHLLPMSTSFGTVGAGSGGGIGIGGSPAMALGHSQEKHHQEAAAVALSVGGLAPPPVLRAASAPCSIPRAPRMSSSEPNPRFLESLPQLWLPPPSVEEGEDAEAAAEDDGDDGGLGQRAPRGGLRQLSSSLRERTMGGPGLAFARPPPTHALATSCPGALAEESLGWPGVAAAMAHLSMASDGDEDEAHGAGASSFSPASSSSSASSSTNGSIDFDSATTGAGTPLAALRGSSLTALSLLVARKLGAGAAPATGGAPSASGLAASPASAMSVASAMATASSSLPSPSLASALQAPGAAAASSSAAGARTGADEGRQGKELAGPSSFSGRTASTAATTSSSVSSKAGVDDDEEDEECGASAPSSGASSRAGSLVGGEAGGVSADAAMGPFELEELALG